MESYLFQKQIKFTRIYKNSITKWVVILSNESMFIKNFKNELEFDMIRKCISLICKHYTILNVFFVSRCSLFEIKHFNVADEYPYSSNNNLIIILFHK